jgi:PKD repeat protein
MKQILNYLILAALVLTCSPGFAQQPNQSAPKKTVKVQVDTRVDNMRYWMEKAEQGSTPYNPNIPIAPAIYKGSQIRSNGVKTVNSPDVPVTNLTNVTESENSVFVDPNNADYILNSNNSTTWTGSTVGSLYGANYFQSSNAGIGWVGTPSGAGGANSGDPTTAIGLNGREYVNFISSASGQGIAYSDNGTTWSTATVAPNPGSMADKNHMWIDNKSTSPYEGNLYVAWTDFGGSDDAEIKTARSTDDGLTWSTPVKLSAAIAAGSHNQGVNIQTGPNGEVYAAWAVYDSWPSDETAIGFAKSTNGGATYAAGSRIISNIKGIRTTAVGKNHRVNSFPAMAVDISGGPNNGNIYIVWTNVGTPGINTGTNKSVYIIRSTNGGTSWSTPVRVNQGPNTAGKEAYFPWISCDPVTGVLSVVFYDDRNVTSTQCEVFAAYSTDAGNNWTDFQVSDVAFTPAAIPGLAGGYMGDYLGITSLNGKVYPCWTDNRGGIYMTYVSPFTIGLNAGFAVNSTTICSGSGVTFTDGSSGPPTSWTWSFPGGTPSSYVGQTPPTITYNLPGNYDVSLTVTDATGTDTETKTGFITVKDLIADFTGTPTTVVVGNSVTFTENSSCSPATWTWSFPGGTPSGFTGQTPPAITYNTLGTYDVTLTVSKPGSSDIKTRVGYIVVTPPIFNITNGTITTCTGDFYDSGGSTGSYQNDESFTETFYPSTAGNMIRFNFTSFSTESGYDFLKIYDGINTAATLIGSYSGTTSPGTVTATNASGALTFVFTSDISVVSTGWAATISCFNPNVPPVANFSATPLNPLVGQTVTFTDLSANTPTSWAWSFIPSTVTYVGGTSASSKNPQVQFSALGFYSATLTATNAYGNNSVTKTNYINVINCTVNTFPWSEGFENGGLIPGCWTQEQVNSSGVNWVFLTGSGNGNPATAHGGTYNACLKDATSADNKTKLVTPALNLSSVSSPQLKFWHTQAYWSPDQDLLTVFYKTSVAGTWTQLSIYTSSITTWTQETINLPDPSATYYIAFEGNAKYGYGVCVDDVSVTCGTTVPVSITIAPSANPVCSGTAVTLTASPVNGGTTPAYQWKVNGNNAGTGTDTFTYTPANNDAVTCVLTSDASCITGNPATSNSVTMVVNPVLAVSVSIAASANPVDAGTTVTFTATPVNGGTTPAYQWTVNGSNAGINSSTYAYDPVNGDVVACHLTSSDDCTSGNPAASNPITMVVNSIPIILNINDVTVTGSQCFNALQTIVVAGNGSSFTVLNGADATLIAGENIIFNPGTTVNPGGYLLGYIAPAGPFCTPPAKPVTTGNKTVWAPAERNFFRVYPNPTNGDFTLALNGYVPSEKISVTIFDMKGTKVISSEFMDEMKHDFSLSGLPAGLYMIRVDSGSQAGSTRIVKVE